MLWLEVWNQQKKKLKNENRYEQISSKTLFILFRYVDNFKILKWHWDKFPQKQSSSSILSSTSLRAQPRARARERGNLAGGDTFMVDTLISQHKPHIFLCSCLLSISIYWPTKLHLRSPLHLYLLACKITPALDQF
jgi:hypothetical protein